MFKSRLATALLIAATVAGCNTTDAPAQAARPVRTVTVEQGAEGEMVSRDPPRRAFGVVSVEPLRTSMTFSSCTS